MGISFKDVKDFATTAVVCSLSPAFCLISAFSGCESSKSPAKPAIPEPEPEPVSPKNPIDEYVSQCDDAAKRMSEVAACGQFEHQTNVPGYSSSASLYIPPNDDQWNVDRLLSKDQCMIKCAWAAPAEPKYNNTGGLCEYFLRVSKNLPHFSPYIYESTVTTEKSRSYGYFDYCLGYGYLP